MHPKVTLIGEPWVTRTMVFGRKKFVFHGGETKSTPVAVALVLKKRRDDDGRYVFKVEDMPEIVVTKPFVEARSLPVQNVARSPKNRKLADAVNY